jgi:hypothetical protein
VVKSKLFFLLLCFFVVSVSAFAEDLPSGYKKYLFGMSMDEVKETIKDDSLLKNVREEVLSVGIEPDKEILTVYGDRRNGGYVEKAYFQFNEDKLFYIYLELSQKKVGYYSLLKSMTDKYGNATNLEPKKASWENDSVRIQIEKPCVLKYVDVKTWDSLSSMEADMEARKIEKIEREKFLEDL